MTASHQPPIVTCTCCATSFEGFASEQAMDCAANIHEDGVRGHYGSSVADMTRLAWGAGEKPAELTLNGIICDACITGMLGDGILVETDECRAAPHLAPNIEDLFDDPVVIAKPGDPQDA